MVARGGVEPPTFRFSVGRSYQLSYLAEGSRLGRSSSGQNLTGACGGHENSVRPHCVLCSSAFWPPSSSGPGPRPFTAVARVRIPLGVHSWLPRDMRMRQISGAGRRPGQHVERSPHPRKAVRDFANGAVPLVVSAFRSESLRLMSRRSVIVVGTGQGIA